MKAKKLASHCSIDFYLSAAQQNMVFQQDIFMTGNRELWHSIGLIDSGLTVLAEEEFYSHLTVLRTVIRSGDLMTARRLVA